MMVLFSQQLKKNQCHFLLSFMASWRIDCHSHCFSLFAKASSSLLASKELSFPVVFRCLTMMCLGMDFFVFDAFGLLILIYNFRPFDKFAKFLSIISSNRFFNPTHFLFWNFEDTHVRHFILISQFPAIIFIFIFLGSFLCVF